MAAWARAPNSLASAERNAAQGLHVCRLSDLPSGNIVEAWRFCSLGVRPIFGSEARPHTIGGAPCSGGSPSCICRPPFSCWGLTVRCDSPAPSAVRHAMNLIAICYEKQICQDIFFEITNSRCAPRRLPTVFRSVRQSLSSHPALARSL